MRLKISSRTLLRLPASAMPSASCSSVSLPTIAASSEASASAIAPIGSLVSFISFLPSLPARFAALATAGRKATRNLRRPRRPKLPSVGMAQTAETRKRAAHLGPERRRPQVLDAALTLFLKGGYDGTSMQAVAEAAGRDEAGRLRVLREQGRALPRAARPRGGADPRRDPGRVRRTPT